MKTTANPFLVFLVIAATIAFGMLLTANAQFAASFQGAHIAPTGNGLVAVTPRAPFNPNQGAIRCQPVAHCNPHYAFPVRRGYFHTAPPIFVGPSIVRISHSPDIHEIVRQENADAARAEKEAAEKEKEKSNNAEAAKTEIAAAESADQNNTEPKPQMVRVRRPGGGWIFLPAKQTAPAAAAIAAAE